MKICLHTVGSFGITNKKQIKLLHFSSKPMEKSALRENYRNKSNQTMMDEGFPLCSWKWPVMTVRMKDMETSM